MVSAERVRYEIPRLFTMNSNRHSIPRSLITDADRWHGRSYYKSHVQDSEKLSKTIGARHGWPHLVVVLALVISTGCRQAKAEKSSGHNGFDLVDKAGNIRKPAGYRDHYQILGTFTVLDAIPMASGSERGAEIRQVVQTSGPTPKRYLVIAAGTPASVGAPVQVQLTP
jgi:hypothetical protein